MNYGSMQLAATHNVVAVNYGLTYITAVVDRRTDEVVAYFHQSLATSIVERLNYIEGEGDPRWAVAELNSAAERRFLAAASDGLLRQIVDLDARDPHVGYVCTPLADYAIRAVLGVGPVPSDRT